MDVTEILEGLNDAQRDAVTSPRGNALVLAGAGSGKTRVLVHRIAWLIRAEGVSPHGVLAVTFTNKAAAEMRGRIESLLNLPVHSMWVGTFHGIAHRLLRIHATEAGLPDNFQILDADDQQRLIKRVLRAFDLDEAKWPARQAAWFINEQKDEGRRAKDLNADSDDPFERTHVRIYAAYEELCRQGGLVDFAELLLRSHELWLENRALLTHYQQRFGEMLVDEFQDTNAIQYAWLRVLAGEHTNIMAVGDDDQSIYGWRGARVENIESFTRDFRDVHVHRLEQNYRSTSTILDAANALIARNQGRMGKSLWTSGKAGEPVLVYGAYNDLDEARFIAERTQQWVDQGGSPSDVAVLYRSNAQSRVIEEALLRARLPYQIYGGLRFFERAEIRNALAYLRLIVNRNSDPSFERVVNVPPRGIGEKTLEAVRTAAREGGVPMWQATKHVIAAGALPARATGALQKFCDLIDEMADAVEPMELGETVEHVTHASGLLEYHLSEKGERGLARKENLEELVTAARQFVGELVLPVDAAGDAQDVRPPLEEFLDHAALESGGDRTAAGGEAVQMMTLHSAKGLEFPLVMLAGVEEGLFPHRMSIEEPGRLEEERRLCYVGITRAREQLYLTYAESRRLHGQDTYNKRSRFIDEIPDDLKREVRLSESVQRPMGGAGLGSSRRSSLFGDPGDEVGMGLRLGQHVRHGSFGEGVVVQVEGSGARATVQIQFDEVGPKWLMLSHAQLALLD